MATPLQSIDPALLALQTAKKAMPASPSTQAPMQSSLNVPKQQSQAISTNIAPPVAKIGGISSPFGATNINSSPVLGGATSQEIGTRAKELQSLPKAIPQTGSQPKTTDNQKYIDLQIDINKGMPFEKMKELYSDIPESAQSDLYNDLKRGMPIEKIPELYPELQGSVQKQGGAKGIIAPTGGFNIPQVQPIAPTTEGNYNPLKTLANAPGSLLNVGINIANMGLSPIQTLKTIAKTAIGGATNLGEIIGEKLAGKENYQEAQQKLLQGEGPVSDFFRFMNESGDNAAQVGDYFKGYADKEELQRRIEEDPAGVLSDVLTVAGYAGGAIQKAGQVSKLGKVAQIGQKIASLEKYDPYTYLPKQAKVLAEKPGLVGKIATPIAGVLNPAETYMNQGKNIIDGIKKAPAVTSDLYQGTKEAYARKVVGLTENTVEAIKSNKYLSEAEGGKLTRDSLTQSAGTLLNKQIQDLSETGRGYSQIRESGIPIDVSSKKPAINKILSDNTIKVNGKGILDFTDSAIESKADQAQLQKVYDYFNRGEVTPDIYLNKKKAIRDMTDFSQGNADQTNRILKQIGSEWKSAGHNSIPELKQLDAIYEPQITDINEIRSKIFDKDGNLREGATSYIMNSLGVNRDVTLQKLEKLMPEISEQVKAIKAVEDINSSKGIRPGTYNKTAAIAGGVKAGAEAGKAIGSYLGSVGEFVGGGIGGIVGAIGGIIATDPAYIINKLRGVDVKLPDEIVQKIQAKQVLSTAQKNKVNDILSSLDKKKQQVIIEQVKKDQKYPIKLKQEGPQTLGATLPKPTPKTPPITVEKGAIGMGTPKVNNTPVIPPKATVAPSVSAPKVDVTPKVNTKIEDSLLQETKKYKTAEEFIKGINKATEDSGSRDLKRSIPAGKVSDLYNPSDKVKGIVSKLRSDNFGKIGADRELINNKIQQVYDEELNKIRQDAQPKPVAPKKFMEGLSEGKPVSPKTKIDDTLLQEAKKYKTADEFMNGKAYTDYGFLLKEGDSIKYRTTNGVFTAKIVSIKNTLHTDNSYVNSHSQNIIADFGNGTKKNISSTDYITEINSKPHEGGYKRKTFADFKQIREQANKKPLPAKGLPKLGKEIMEQNITQGDDLISEAKKYKTADEFVNDNKKLFHTTSELNAQKINSEGFVEGKGKGIGDRLVDGVFFVDNELPLPTITKYSKEPSNIVKGFVSKNSKIKEFKTMDDFENYLLKDEKYISLDDPDLSSKRAKEIFIQNGIDVIIKPYGKGTEYIVVNPKVLKTESQLKQIREQANKKPLPPLPKKGK